MASPWSKGPGPFYAVERWGGYGWRLTDLVSGTTEDRERARSLYATAIKADPAGWYRLTELHVLEEHMP